MHELLLQLTQLADCVVDGVAHIALDNKGDLNYEPPYRPYVAFGGAGATIGGSSSAESITFSVDTIRNARVAILNDQQPSTTLQVKLHDGKKLRLKYVFISPLNSFNL
jgi:hypothetical protein